MSLRQSGPLSPLSGRAVPGSHPAPTDRSFQCGFHPQERSATGDHSSAHRTGRTISPSASPHPGFSIPSTTPRAVDGMENSGRSGVEDDGRGSGRKRDGSVAYISKYKYYFYLYPSPLPSRMSLRQSNPLSPLAASNATPIRQNHSATWDHSSARRTGRTTSPPACHPGIFHSIQHP